MRPLSARRATWSSIVQVNSIRVEESVAAEIVLRRHFGHERCDSALSHGARGIENPLLSPLRIREARTMPHLIECRQMPLDGQGHVVRNRSSGSWRRVPPGPRA